MLQTRRWEELTWTDFPGLDPETVAILPIGAIEQHGPHLPLMVDSALNQGILERALMLAPDDLPLLVLPLQPVGLSVEHQRFPGTLSLEPETTLALWTDLGASVARAGLRRLLLFNSHGGQTQIMNLVCTRLRLRHRMLAVGASWFRLRRPGMAEQSLPEAERIHGIHAGAVETAMMLHLHPETVRSEHIDDFSSTWVETKKKMAMRQMSPEGPIGFGWETQDLHPSGAVGDARLGNRAMGEQLVEESARALVELLQEIHRLPIADVLREETTAVPR